MSHHHQPTLCMIEQLSELLIRPRIAQVEEEILSVAWQGRGCSQHTITFDNIGGRKKLLAWWF